MANRLIALFKYEDDLLAAAGRLKESGFDDVTVMSPIHLHGAEKVLGLRALAGYRHHPVLNEGLKIRCIRTCPLTVHPLRRRTV